jgi:hypothetical protein
VNVHNNASPKPYYGETFKDFALLALRPKRHSEGPHFSPNYANLLHKWQTRLLLTMNREIASAIFEGARNARGGERQFAAGRGLAESNLPLFEPV